MSKCGIRSSFCIPSSAVGWRFCLVFLCHPSPELVMSLYDMCSIRVFCILLSSHCRLFTLRSMSCPRHGSQNTQLIREHALHVLRLLAELMPNELLNAHKTSVLVALAAAIEDRKRSVRRAAVRCRNTWYVCLCGCGGCVFMKAREYVYVCARAYMRVNCAR
jgi:hypothetical protein